MKKASMIAAAALCCWTSLAAAEGFEYVSFKRIAKMVSSAPEARHSQVGEQTSKPAPSSRSQAIRTGCAHLGLGEQACKWYCIAGERDGRYYDVWCQRFTDGPTPGGTDYTRTTCNATVYVDVASGAILPEVRGDNRSWKTDDGFTCAAERHPAPSGGWSPIPW